MIGKKSFRGLAVLMLAVPFGLSSIAPAVAAPMTEQCVIDGSGTVCPVNQWMLNAEGTDYAGQVFMDATTNANTALDVTCLPEREPSVALEGIDCYYSLTRDDENELNYIDEPAVGSFSELGLSTVPGFFYESQVEQRSFVFQNPTDEALTVTSFKAEVSHPDLAGDSTVDAVVDGGTDVLAEPVLDFTVPAGEQVEVPVAVSRPLVSMVRMNSEGDVSGFGSVVRYDFVLNGKTYWFDEYSGMGSVSPNDVPWTEVERTDALLPAELFMPSWTSGDNPYEGSIGYFGFMSNFTGDVVSSYYTPENAPTLPPEPPTDVYEPVVPEVPVVPEPPLEVRPVPSSEPTMPSPPVGLKTDHPVTGVDENRVEGFLVVGSIFLFCSGVWVAAISAEPLKEKRTKRNN